VRYGSTVPRHHGLLGPGRLLPRLLARRAIDFCNPDDLVCSFAGSGGEIWMASWAGRSHTRFYERPAVVAVNGKRLYRVMRLHGVG
jgi:hypothetical protein